MPRYSRKELYCRIPDISDGSNAKRHDASPCKIFSEQTQSGKSKSADPETQTLEIFHFFFLSISHGGRAKPDKPQREAL